MEWAGPARCTDAYAIAMGFDGVTGMTTECLRIRAALTDGGGLTAADWARAVLATETAFTSDTMGSGYEWATTTGLTDAWTIKTLRSLQRKLTPLMVHVDLGHLRDL
ncbi:hypothetical protein [Spongiactinospora sp. TRM90649]|uniref:hypothetical protein n=1 Tax=Spongiactinospora sp. TRM90649 TaxID=3031114 RepID=UPI0023F7E588|nr:hypothetical protein [Spongiactinospora sp. TRM90649]MDF5751843.1 hypothetical protein [Spongiactinospora sp. TRM90649]